MRFLSLIGLAVLLGIAWLMSNNKRKIRPRIIIWGVGLQLLFAMIILSESLLSMLGMFIFLNMILMYVFSGDIVNAGERGKQYGMIVSILGGALLMSAVGYLMAQRQLAWLLLLLAAGGATWAGYKKKLLLQRVAVAIFLSGGFGLIYARDWYGKIIFRVLSEKVDSFLRLTDLGTAFLFGNLIKSEYFFPNNEFWPGFGFQFAFAVLPTIVFFAAFMAILYYFGIIQVIVQVMARFMRWTLGTSGAETLSCSANIFVGQTEAPLLIKPYLEGMTVSELTTVMVGGFATIAGGVLAGYIRMGIDAGHLIAASVMSAPAALVMGKMIFPETEHSQTAGDVEMPKVQTANNVLEAASNGITDGLKLAVNVGAMLIGFIALIGLLDVILNFMDRLVDGMLIGGERYPVPYNPFSPVTHEFAGVFPGSLKTLFGNVLRYLAFAMGTPWKDSIEVGNLLGLKLAVNEFVAYSSLGNLIKAGALTERSTVIATYALCGFANFASIGIQLGGIGAIAPSRRGDLARVGFRAMIGGALASWMTATIAGMLL